jgi:hypothetical protein
MEDPIDVHSQLQILSASAWYCTTPSVATEQRFQIAINQYFCLILNYLFSCCNQIVVRVAIDLHSALQIMSASAWYCTTPSVATDSGSSCNWCTLRVANTEFFCLILYWETWVPTEQGLIHPRQVGSACQKTRRPVSGLWTTWHAGPGMRR